MVKSSSPEQSPRDADVKPAFRKPSGDAASRKYRRRSPAESSSPPAAGSPNGDRSRSPDAPRRDRDSNMKQSDDYRRHGDDRDLHRSGERRRHGGEYSHRRRHSEDVDSNYHPSRSSRESGDRSRIGYLKQRLDYDRRDSEKHSRDQLDERNYRSQGRERETRDRHRDRDGGRDVRKASSNFMGEEKCDPGSTHEESRIHHHDLASSGRSDSPHAKDRSPHGNCRELDSEKEGKRKADEKKFEGSKEYSYRESDRSRKEENNTFYGKDSRKDKFVDTDSKVDNNGSSGKRTKTERVSGFSEGPLLSKFSTFVEGKQMPCPQEPTDGTAKSLQVTPASRVEVANDVNAAKVAAMKAAELVNRNIVGCGILSTDQKKKLLWGNKKSTSTVESGNRWDTSLVGDKERQEKFNKLMSLRLPWYVWPIVGCERRCATGEGDQRQGLGEAKSSPVGVGEAIYCWSSPKGWSHCRIRSVVVSVLSDVSVAACFCAFKAPELEHWCCFVHPITILRKLIMCVIAITIQVACLARILKTVRLLISQ